MPSLKKYIYSFELVGEDNTHFVWDCDANSLSEAYKHLLGCYPEARIRSRERFDAREYRS